MNEQEIIQQAMHHVFIDGNINPDWVETYVNDNIDGRLVLNMKHHPPLQFNAEVKKELRAVHLNYIEDQAKYNKPYIVIAERLYPKIKEELRTRKINYLEANGNMYLLTDGVYVNIDGKKPLENLKTFSNRAFTKTGLKVIYLFLTDQNWINRTYRDIADQADTGLGNINNIFNGLKQEGFLLQLNKNEYKFENKKKLLEKWIIEYDRKLKPMLALGTFRFLKEEDFYEWRIHNLQEGKTVWGGEPAGQIYTNYLRPEQLTIYTSETTGELMRNYRLVPDHRGNVHVYKKFWRQDEQTYFPDDQVVHPLLAYADLMNTGDRRCTETAEKIYDEYLQDKF
jgi:hypothetical protein